MRKILLGVAAVVTLLILGVAGLLVSTFSGLAQATPRTELPNGVIGVADGYVQVFIIPIGDDGAALIDCGQDPEAKPVREELAKSKRTVKAIFLTHGHSDHIGGCRAFSGAEIYSLSAEKPVVEGETAARGPMPRFAKNDPAKAPRVTRTLTDGETVTIGETTVRVFAVPGHTVGSAAYLSKGNLFLGDAAAGQADGKVRNAPWFFSDDTAQSQQSLRALAKTVAGEDVQALVFAHSGPLRAFDALKQF